jgi:predicted secreted protein
MNYIHGNNLLVIMGGTAIAGAKSCEIVIQDDEMEVSSATQGEWREFISAIKDWSASCGHLLPASGTPMKSAAAMIGQKVTITFQTDMTGDTLTGQAIVKQWKTAGAVGNLATGTYQFRGSGALV